MASTRLTDQRTIRPLSQCAYNQLYIPVSAVEITIGGKTGNLTAKSNRGLPPDQLREQQERHLHYKSE